MVEAIVTSFGFLTARLCVLGLSRRMSLTLVSFLYIVIAIVLVVLVGGTWGWLIDWGMQHSPVVTALCIAGGALFGVVWLVCGVITDDEGGADNV